MKTTLNRDTLIFLRKYNFHFDEETGEVTYAHYTKQYVIESMDDGFPMYCMKDKKTNTILRRNRILVSGLNAKQFRDNITKYFRLDKVENKEE